MIPIEGLGYSLAGLVGAIGAVIGLYLDGALDVSVYTEGDDGR